MKRQNANERKRERFLSVSLASSALTQLQMLASLPHVDMNLITRLADTSPGAAGFVLINKLVELNQTTSGVVIVHGYGYTMSNINGKTLLHTSRCGGCDGMSQTL